MTARTLAEKLVARAAGRTDVTPGEIVTCKVDLAMMHDSGGPRRVEPMLERLGFALAIFPGGTARAAAFAFAEYFASLRAHGTTAPYRGRMIDFDALQRLLGRAEMLAAGRRYDDRGV